MIRHVGTFDLIDLPTPETYTPGTGIVRTLRTKMLKTSVPAYVAGLASLGYGYEIQPSETDPYAIVTTITSPELTTTWTLDGNDMEKAIWQLPKVRAMLALVSDLKVRAAYRTEIERFVRGEYEGDSRKTLDSIKALITNFATVQSNANPTAPTRPQVDGLVGEITDGLVSSLVDGVESFPLSTYVLRKTMVLNPATNVSPAFEDSNKLFTFTRLVQEEPTIPLNIAGILTEIRGYWQKKTPQASQAADGRWTYTGEYWWADDYDPFLYEVLT